VCSDRVKSHEEVIRRSYLNGCLTFHFDMMSYNSSF
jgi:hypothetical protein